MEYKLYSASGNPTALVYGKPDTMLAKAILANDKRAEQVGFLSGNLDSGFRLDMAGGEFCGNAARCAIYDILGGKPGEICVSVSGFDGIIKGGVSENGDVWAVMPRLTEMLPMEGGSVLVRLPGISHLVVESDELSGFYPLLEKLKKFENNVPAIGIIGVKNDKMYPVVWVRDIETLFEETACGSGITAAAYAKGRSVRLLQPWGEYLNADLKDGTVTLSGPVKLL